LAPPAAACLAARASQCLAWRGLHPLAWRREAPCIKPLLAPTAQGGLSQVFASAFGAPGKRVKTAPS